MTISFPASPHEIGFGYQAIRSFLCGKIRFYKLYMLSFNIEKNYENLSVTRAFL
ncbi:hypothetical protein [uncultured Microscilla sp.]|uniref:hypothetical protein n=1 Tax=uncultured Microscilla sp. TaxID=432653 RepID=UPI0026396E8C|nr:hypothetical protein [uncultured Microscilla sp.]